MSVQFATLPGREDHPNEDFAGAFPNCAVLLDGAGGPSEMPSGCIHGTSWYVRQLGARLLASMETSPHALPVILANTIDDVSKLHAGTCDLDAPGTPSATVIMTRVGDENAEYLVLGDSTLILSEDTGPRVISDHRIDNVAAAERKAMDAIPASTPEHQTARIWFVTRQRAMRNEPGGYWITSTDPDAAFHARTGTVALHTLRRVTLLSDGVARFVEFGLGTWPELVRLLDLYGPAGVFGRIRYAEGIDPDGVQWPRAKVRDDMAVVHFTDLGAGAGTWAARTDGWDVPVKAIVGAA